MIKNFKIKRILKRMGKIEVGGKDSLNRAKADLFNFMERYPVRKNDFGRQEIRGGKFLKFNLKPMPIIIGAIIAALLGGGGAVYASQDSLPGDALYPVKLMAEDVQTVAARNSERGVGLEAKFANRRLEEVKKLQERLKNKNGEVPLGIIEKAMERAEQKLGKAQEKIARMEEGKRKERTLEASSRLEDALQIHQQILSDLANEVPESAGKALLHAQEAAAKHSVKVFERVLKLEKIEETERKNREKLKEGLPIIVGAKERTEGKINALENRLRALENFIENLKEQERDVGEYQAKMEEAKIKMEEAKKMIEEEKYLESFRASHEAMNLMIQIQLLVRSKFAPGQMPGMMPKIPKNLLPESESDKENTSTSTPVQEPATIQQQNQYQNQFSGDSGTESDFVPVQQQNQYQRQGL